VAAQHCRRYSTSEIRDKRSKWFQGGFISQSMACIFPLIGYSEAEGFRKQSDLVDAKALANEEFRCLYHRQRHSQCLADVEACGSPRAIVYPMERPGARLQKAYLTRESSVRGGSVRVLGV